MEQFSAPIGTTEDLKAVIIVSIMTVFLYYSYKAILWSIKNKN